MGFPAYEILSGLCRGVEECVGERCAGCDRLRFATPILIVDGHCIRTGSRGCPAGEEAHDCSEFFLDPHEKFSPVQ